MNIIGMDFARISALRKGDGHKYTHGHAVVICGPPGHGGAARLTARAALRSGAGLVTLICLPAALPENAARLDAIMIRQMEDADIARWLRGAKATALCLGPGLGVDRAPFLRQAARDADLPTVLDADALCSDGLPTQAVLTPHSGEFQRVFPALTGSKPEITGLAARQSGAVILHKGADTVIASPDGRTSLCDTSASPWLATAGSGDVLAGIITGLLARGLPLMQAAESAAWLHAEAARSFGPGLIAEDLPEELPKVFRALGV